VNFFRSHWFSLSVFSLLAVIAVNLFALNSHRSFEKAEPKQASRQLAHAAPLPKSDAATKPDNHKPTMEPGKTGQKEEPADHRMMDKGMMMGKGMMGKGMMGMMQGNMMADMMDIRFLLLSHEKITRTVKRLPEGVETTTTSADEAVAGKIQAHVKTMYERLQKKQVIRPMDPLFAAIVENADKIDMAITTLPDGVRVKETSKDPYTVKLIHAHAEVVDRFVQEGMPAMMKITPVPGRE